VVAFGTSAPELATSLAAALAGRADLAFGNVVGSNTFNVLVVLGASAAIAPLFVDRRIVRVEVPIALAAAALLAVVGWDGVVGRREGALLFAGLLAYVAFTLRGSGSEPDDPKLPGRPRRDPRTLGVCVLQIVSGLALLVLGSRWLVAAATELARSLGVSELVIGLTVVAAGTSLPELATSLVAAMRGERDIAVGNVLGSNVFNVLGVLGLSAALAPAGVAVAGPALRFDVPVTIAATLACLPICFTGWRISRAEGWLLLAGYGGYLAALILAARQPV
jgi:cation:H+ antiporter